MRNVALLASRTVLGTYLAAHGAQKMFGAFGGPGLDAAGAGFHAMGLRPGKPFATLAAASEIGGGLLTVAGIADPIGPVAIAGSMAVASAVHRKAGPMAAKGGYELPAVNLALALALVAAGPGKLKVGGTLPKHLTQVLLVGAVAATALSLTKLLTQKPAETAPEPAPAT
jgi:putative oxidoreductase